MKKKGTAGTEQQILQAAEEEFVQKGFAGARMTEIARRAGVGHPLLHYYFNTKEMLFRRVFQDKFALFAIEIHSTMELDNTSVTDKVCTMMAHHFDFLRANSRLPLFIINALNEHAELAEGIIPKVQELASSIIERLQNEIDSAARRGEIVATDASTLLIDIFNLNVATFLTLPILSKSFTFFGEDVATYYDKRRQENLALIRNRLKP